MESITEVFRPRVYEYHHFMKSFKRHHPALYAKYRHRIMLPSGQSSVVTVSQDGWLKSSAREMLGYIISEYYRPFNN